MCGITGILNFNNSPVEYEILKKMTDSISHRGPDGEGFYIDKNIGFGHRRLSIIDLSDAGSQPMISMNGRYILSYNGEVYNFKELRNTLRSLNYNFKSETDTEVVLNSWVEWGEECVNKFNGMFAFSIWDKKENLLYLVRDRYGIKPLYYAYCTNFILFGSEQRAILKHPDFDFEVDKKGLVEYFTFQNFFTNRTLTKGVRILEAGSIAKISVDNGGIIIKKYWDYNFKEPVDRISTNSYYHELDRLLKQAIQRQLVSDVELGCYLSGGMDSGTIVALASKDIPNLKTFTCGFDLSSASGTELNFDERSKAKSLSKLYNTNHFDFILKSEDMQASLEAVVNHLEEPRVGQSYPNYYVARLASEKVKVVLSGTGGDELFGGYPWRYYQALSNDNFEEYVDNYYLYWQRLIPNSEIKKIFSPISSDIEDLWTRDIFRSVFQERKFYANTPEEFINRSLYFEARTFLHGLLHVEDKLSMAHSLETRVPFLDNDLVDFAMSCPVDLKLSNITNITRINENDLGIKKEIYFQKTNDGKKILRDVMRNYVPSEITDATKQGFSSPDASWFAGESSDFVKKKFWNQSTKIFKYLDEKSVKNLINQHLSGNVNRRLLIWSLLNVEEWLRQMQTINN